MAQRKGVIIREYSGADTVPEQIVKDFGALMETTGQRDHFRVRDVSYFQRILRALRSDARILVAYLEEKPIGGAIEVFCGRKAWYLYGASANEHRSVMPNYLLQWTMIHRAMERNCDTYDFRGVPGDPSEEDPLYGLYRFKKGFGGTYTKFSGLFSYSFRPAIGKIAEWAIGLRRRRSR